MNNDAHETQIDTGYPRLCRHETHTLVMSINRMDQPICELGHWIFIFFQFSAVSEHIIQNTEIANNSCEEVPSLDIEFGLYKRLIHLYN